MPTVEEAFESPRLVLDGARADIQRVGTLTEEFMAENPCRIGIEQRGKRGIAYIEITKYPPPELRRGVYRAVNDLRNALDQAVYGSSGSRPRWWCTSREFLVRLDSCSAGLGGQPSELILNG